MSIRPLLIPLMCLLWTACVSSPEVRRGDEAFERGDHVEAVRQYRWALRFGLRDPDVKARTTARLQESESHLEGKFQRDLSRLRDVDAQALDAQALEMLQPLRSAPCNPKKLGTLNVKLQDADRSRAVRQEAAAQFSACSISLVSDIQRPKIFALLMVARASLRSYEPAAARDLERAISQGLLTSLRRPESALPLLRTLEVTVPSWRSLPDARAIQRAWVQGSVSLLDRRSTSDPTETCRRWSKVSSSATRARVKTQCQRAVSASLTTLESPRLGPSQAISLAERLLKTPMSSSNHQRVMSALGRVAAPWRARARVTKSLWARAFYLSVADAIDRQSSAKSARDRALSITRSFGPPEVKLVNASGSCSSKTSSMRDALKSSASSSASSSAATLKINLTSCVSDVKTTYRVLRSTRIKTNERCETNVKYKKEIGQECKGGDVIKNGRTMYDPCKYRVAFKRTKPIKSQSCTHDTDTAIIERATVCWRQDLAGSVSLTSGGRVVTSNTPTAVRGGACSSGDLRYYASGGRPSLPGEVELYREVRAREKSFYDAMTRGMGDRARRFASKTHAARLAQARRQARSLASRGTDDARVESAMLLRALSDAGSGKRLSSLKIPSSISSMAPTPSVAQALTSGTTRSRPARIPLERVGEPHTPSLQRFQGYRKTWVTQLAKDLRDLEERKVAKDRKLARKAEAPTISAPTQAGWLSTGRLVTASRGPSLVWKSRSGPSDWAMSTAASIGQRLLQGAPALDVMWSVGVTLGPIHLGGGGRTPVGQTRGGQLSARWLGGPHEEDAPLDPGLVWSAGLQLDWVDLSGEPSYALRAPVEWNVPVLEWLSVDAALEPDLLGLASMLGVDPGVDTRAASSQVWVGATATAWQGRAALHIHVGPSVSAAAFLPAAWRTELQVRF